MTKHTGRPAGPNWDGSGEYELKERRMITISQQNNTWLKTQPNASKLIDELVTAAREAAEREDEENDG